MNTISIDLPQTALTALILAKQKGLISSVSEELTGAQKEGLWLSDEIIELIKQKAGE